MQRRRSKTGWLSPGFSATVRSNLTCGVRIEIKSAAGMPAQRGCRTRGTSRFPFLRRGRRASRFGWARRRRSCARRPFFGETPADFARNIRGRMSAHGGAGFSCMNSHRVGACDPQSFITRISPSTGCERNDRGGRTKKLSRPPLAPTGRATDPSVQGQ
jgi:hypothetical protein